MKTEYTIVYDTAMDIFEAKVNHLIEKGWQVTGGICVNGGFYQAMTLVDIGPQSISAWLKESVTLAEAKVN